MSIINIFSKRKKRSEGNDPDVFTYDEIPQELRIQVVQIIQEAVGTGGYNEITERPYLFVYRALCREYGMMNLGERRGEPKEALLNFILQTPDTSKVLDAIELLIKYIDITIRERAYYSRDVNVMLSPDEAVSELNYRFREHGIGYQYTGHQLIRMDSTYIHKNIILPAINLLADPKFKGANDEYLKAHDHYKNGRNKECLTECLKSFESTMKIICSEKGWLYNSNDTSKKLIQVCLQNGIIPSFTQNQFTSLQSLLESGIPTIRNRLGGHGQGQAIQKVDDEMARYALNLTGTNIVFLIEQSSL